MVELRASEGSDELATPSVALEKQDVESVSLREELLLCDLLLLPEYIGTRCQCHYLVTLRLHDVDLYGCYPSGGLSFIFRLEFELTIVAVDCDREDPLSPLMLHYVALIEFEVEPAAANEVTTSVLFIVLEDAIFNFYDAPLPAFEKCWTEFLQIASHGRRLALTG